MSQDPWRLTIERGPHAGSAYPLHGGTITIGRNPDNQIVIQDPLVSRYHARLTWQGSTFLLEDLGSANGTWVNDARITSPVLLRPGDSIGLSHVLHCIPGPMEAKGTAISNLASVLAPDGVLFGATMLGLDAEHTTPARFLIRVGNKQGGFDNLTDTAEGLRSILEASFEDVQVRVVGSMAEFEARQPRRHE